MILLTSTFIWGEIRIEKSHISLNTISSRKHRFWGMIFKCRITLHSLGISIRIWYDMYWLIDWSIDWLFGFLLYCTFAWLFDCPLYYLIKFSSLLSQNAWFGPEGTVSPLHHDPKHNLLCQVFGEKYVRLYEESENAHVYPHQSPMLFNTSQVDVENPDLAKFPDFSQARFSDYILRPGDCLYIPPRCWHYLRSLSISFSVSFWFSEGND